MALEAAREISELRRFYPTKKIVGVFKDANLDEIESAANLCDFDLVECHGKETPEFCRAVSKPVIKVIVIESVHSPARAGYVRDVMAQYSSSVEYFLFDRPKSMKDDDTWLEGAIATLEEVGFDLSCQSLAPYFFAGGLDSVSIKSVISRLKPFAVDVASGVDCSRTQRPQ